MALMQQTLEWKDGDVPVSTRFDDPYFSLHSGLEETRHVFLAGNNLPERFEDGFHIAELGFGTGLNLLATWHMWRATQQRGRLRFSSFEAFPMAQADMARALQAFPELGALAGIMLSEMGPEGFETDDLTFALIEGDARAILPTWEGPADAWFLDGFSPAKNPELWSADLMHAVGRCTASGGTAATYTAAGHVRRALDEAGFDVRRVGGFGRKRHMTVAALRS